MAKQAHDPRTTRKTLVDDIMSYAEARPDDGWWIAESPRMVGAITQGRTRTEALKNLRSGVRDLLASYAKDGERPPLVRVRG
jgi:predicted RNase H-like HicB family nuclease